MAAFIGLAADKHDISENQRDPSVVLQSGDGCLAFVYMRSKIGGQGNKVGFTDRSRYGGWGRRPLEKLKLFLFQSSRANMYIVICTFQNVL